MYVNGSYTGVMYICRSVARRRTIFAVRVNLLVLTRPNLANNYRNSSVDFFHVHFVIVIVLVIQVLFRSNCTFYLSSFCISVLVLLLK